MTMFMRVIDLAMYYCPSCREMINTPIGVYCESESEEIYSCKCGMTWRTITSDIHYIVTTNKKDEIRKVLENTLQVYYTKKNEEVNKARELRKQRAIEYLMVELFKGPFEGGTLSHPDSICDLFGNDLWVALQRSILIRDEMCMICNQRPSKEVHHIRPRHLKGQDHPRNLIGLCLECHDEVHRKIDDGIQSMLESSLKINPPKFQTTFEVE